MPIQIANLESFLNELKRASEAVEDLTLPLTLIGRDFMRSNKALFQLKGPGQFADLSNGSGSKKHVWLSDMHVRVNGKSQKLGAVGGYKLAKLKRWGFIYPILKASGALERSLTDPTDPNAVLQVINGNTLLLGTKVTSKKGAPYPVFLHMGTKRMPARPYLTIPNDRLGRWNNTLNEYVLKALGAPGTAATKPTSMPEIED